MRKINLVGSTKWTREASREAKKWYQSCSSNIGAFMGQKSSSTVGNNVYIHELFEKSVERIIRKGEN